MDHSNELIDIKTRDGVITTMRSNLLKSEVFKQIMLKDERNGVLFIDIDKKIFRSILNYLSDNIINDNEEMNYYYNKYCISIDNVSTLQNEQVNKNINIQIYLIVQYSQQSISPERIILIDSNNSKGSFRNPSYYINLKGTTLKSSHLAELRYNMMESVENILLNNNYTLSTTIDVRSGSCNNTGTILSIGIIWFRTMIDLNEIYKQLNKPLSHLVDYASILL
jgi:hypothetical protein